MPSLTETCSEKYLKGLAGRTDLVDALKKLDKLTLEEARLATAQNLKATHTVDNRVRGVDVKVAALMEGTQMVFSWTSKLNLISRWKRSEGSHPTNSR